MTWRLLDTFCKAGGASTGYARAGFAVIGVDIEPQPRYPFTFRRADAIELLVALAERGEYETNAGDVLRVADFDAIAASPVCKLYSSATPSWARGNHENQIPPVRAALDAIGLPYVIENVPLAPLRADFRICGCTVGLAELERERWFETNWYRDLELIPPCCHLVQPYTVAGHGEPSGPRRARVAMVAGHGESTKSKVARLRDYERRQVISVVGGGPDYGPGKANRAANVADWRRAMGIEWMTRDELSQAIPPAYTEYIGERLIRHLEESCQTG